MKKDQAVNFWVSEEDKKYIEVLKRHNINISGMLRAAIREMAEKLQKEVK